MVKISITDDFLDPIIYTKRTQGFVQQIENLLISGNRVLLQELPDNFQKVTINYNVSAYSASSTYALHDIVSYSGAYYRCIVAITTPETWTAEHWVAMPNGTLMTEITSGAPLEGQYLVNYITGVITFNSYDNAKSVNCVYFGVGRFRIPSSMVYTSATNDIATETLEGLTESLEGLASYIYSYATDTGTDDSYIITLSPAPTLYIEGMQFSFKANTANIGACTINVNGLGTKSIKKNVNVDLADNDILAGQIVCVVYDGTNFQLIR